jgi:hypothetical protein
MTTSQLPSALYAAPAYANLNERGDSMKKCRIIEAVEYREAEKDVLFAVLTLLVFLIVALSLWAEVV